MAADFFGKFSAVVAPSQIVAPPVAAAVRYEPSRQYIIWIIAFVVLILAIVLAS